MKDLTNQTFGNVKVIERAGSNKHNQSRWRCLCLLCGKEFYALAHNLKSGNTTSCGCTRGVQRSSRRVT